jgi:hypothetical protein
MADGSDPAPSYPMPGRSEFSADEEKAMRKASGRQIGTDTPIRLDKATGNITEGEPEPLMGHSIPKSQF